MTRAVCMRCGARKFGAIVPCDACGFQPRRDEEIATSMLFSEHHLPHEKLDELAEDIRETGEPPPIPSNTMQAMLREVRNSNIHGMTGLGDPPQKDDCASKGMFAGCRDRFMKLFHHGSPPSKPITVYIYSMTDGSRKDEWHLGEELDQETYDLYRSKGIHTVYLVVFDRPDDKLEVKEANAEDWHALVEAEEHARATGGLMDMLREHMDENKVIRKSRLCCELF